MRCHLLRLAFLLGLLYPLLSGCSLFSDAKYDTPEVGQVVEAGPDVPVHPPLELAGLVNGQDSIYLRAYPREGYPDLAFISGQAVIAPPIASKRKAMAFWVQGKLQADSTYKLWLEKIPLDAEASKPDSLCLQTTDSSYYEGLFTSDASQGNTSVKLYPMNSQQQAIYQTLFATHFAPQRNSFTNNQELTIGVHSTIKDEYKLIFNISENKDKLTSISGFFIANDSPIQAVQQYFPIKSGQTVKATKKSDVYNFIKLNVELVDINQDEYNDIRILVKQFQKQEHFHYFVYHPKKKEFMDWGVQINPKFDDEKQEMTAYTWMSSNSQEYIEVQSHLENGFFVPQVVEEKRLTPVKDSLLYIVWKRAPFWYIDHMENDHLYQYKKKKPVKASQTDKAAK
jgi:hypothetical protein